MTQPLICYLWREGEYAILQRVQLAGAQDAHVPRFAATQAELLVASQISIQVAKYACGLHLDGRHLSDCLHVQVVFGQLVADVIVLGQNHHLHDHVGLLLRPQATIQGVQLAHCQESLRNIITIFLFNN